MAKSVKKKKENDYVILNPFSTSKKEYKIGDVINLTCEKQIAYLKSINKI
jgi:hypothetical protein